MFLEIDPKVEEISSKTKLPNSVVQNTKQQILNKYPKLFEGLGELNGEYNIMITPNAEPYALNVPRKVSGVASGYSRYSVNTLQFPEIK